MNWQFTSTQSPTESVFFTIAFAPDVSTSQIADEARKSSDEKDYKGILRATARHYDLSIADIKGSRRFRHIVRPRHVAMYLLREQGLSFPFIAKLLGGLDHTTVMNGCRSIEALQTKDEQVKRALNIIRETL